MKSLGILAAKERLDGIAEGRRRARALVEHDVDVKRGHVVSVGEIPRYLPSAHFRHLWHTRPA
jgi:hypothetical protein